MEALALVGFTILPDSQQGSQVHSPADSSHSRGTQEQSPSPSGREAEAGAEFYLRGFLLTFEEKQYERASNCAPRRDKGGK
jgi:hypothetical protein